MGELNIQEIEDSAKRIYDASFEINMLQDELEDLLTTIDKNIIEYQKDEIPKEIFESNETKLKLQSSKKIKRINGLVETSLEMLDGLKDEFQLSQKKEEPRIQANPKPRITEKKRKARARKRGNIAKKKRKMPKIKKSKARSRKKRRR